tara:strand:+ start:738 stop:1064 length:327 start_codon:yes stop_codon:yes gene_type:complete
MKWSYTSGKINVSSDEEEQQFLLEELIEEASRHQARKKKILIFFVVLSAILLVMQNYGADLAQGMSMYFYIGYFLTPMIISLFISSVVYLLIRRSPKKFKRLNKHLED